MKARKWVGYDFNRRGWSTTHENKSDAWTQFVRDTRSDLRSMLKGTGWKLHVWKGNWFCASGFLYNEEFDQWVYISISDVRHWQDAWFERLLIRTAEHEKDYTGGRNQYCNFYGIPEQLERMFAYA